MEAARQLNSIPGLTRLVRVADRITQGSNPRFVTRGLPCVNGKNIYFGTMLKGDPNYVSAEEFQRLSGYALRRDDLVITLKHATKVGRVWIVEDDERRIFSRNVGLIRLRTDSPIRPSVLLLYLWTTAGQLLIDRCATGGTTGQITLPMSELRRVPIPPISSKEQDEIETLFSVSRNSAALATSHYESARKTYEAELGLDRLTFRKPTGYSARFSDLETAHRLDAQHYQPRFKQLIDHLSAFRSEPVRNIRIYNRRGLQPIYVRRGPINVVNSQHLGPRHIDYEGLQRTSTAAFAGAPEAHVQKDDLLIYTTGAYIGRTNVYLSDAPAMASNHVNILRLRPGIDSAYMALVFQSVVGQFQTQKHARGSAQAELYPRDIDRFVVPLLDEDKQQVIGDLVRESLIKQRESWRVLEQAKARVEKLIEEAVEA
jgi:type I restriction enzyme, S subunit